VLLPELAHLVDALLELPVLGVDLERDLLLVPLLGDLADGVAEGLELVLPHGKDLLAVAGDPVEVGVAHVHEPLGAEDAQHLAAQVPRDGLDELQVAVDRVVGVLRALEVREDGLDRVRDLAHLGRGEEVVDGEVLHHGLVLGHHLLGLLEADRVRVECSRGVEALGLLQRVQGALGLRRLELVGDVLKDALKLDPELDLL